MMPASSRSGMKARSLASISSEARSRVEEAAGRIASA
jgi:hypothetical protein